MAITRVSAGSAKATSMTLPTHAAGDLIVMIAGKSTSGLPTIPAGWTTIQSSSSSTISFVIAYKIAASSSESSGTWTNAGSIGATVYRKGGSDGNWIVPTASSVASKSGTTIPWPAHTLSLAGTSWAVRLGAGTLLTSGTHGFNSDLTGYNEALNLKASALLNIALAVFDNGPIASNPPSGTSTISKSNLDCGVATIQIGHEAPTGLPVKQEIGGVWQKIGVLKGYNGLGWVSPKRYDGTTWV